MAVHEFVFTNNGNQPLVLTAVKASCGCTTPSWTKEPVLPGQSGHIKASYNSKNRPGRFHKSITITSNAVHSLPSSFYKRNRYKERPRLSHYSIRKNLQMSPRILITAAASTTRKSTNGKQSPHKFIGAQ